jgi:phosphohistidine phosphatase
LVRHAKAIAEHRHDQRDFDRPLADRGSADAIHMGRRFAVRAARPDLMVSSTAMRALQTAQAIADAIGRTTASIVTRDDLYLASARTLLEIVRETEASVVHLLLVGHNPGMSDLWGRLSNERAPSLPTCGIVRLELPRGSWRDTADGDAILLDFDHPRRGDAARG